MPRPFGWNHGICETLCGKRPQGGTPGGLIGKWQGLDISHGYKRVQYTFDFEPTSVTVYKGQSMVWEASVRTYGAGLFFLFTAPPALAMHNASALFALSRTASGTLMQSLDLAVGVLDAPMPYDFNDPMLAGLGQFVLISL